MNVTAKTKPFMGLHDSQHTLNVTAPLSLKEMRKGMANAILIHCFVQLYS